MVVKRFRPYILKNVLNLVSVESEDSVRYGNLYLFHTYRLESGILAPQIGEHVGQGRATMVAGMNSNTAHAGRHFKLPPRLSEPTNYQIYLDGAGRGYLFVHSASRSLIWADRGTRLAASR